MLRGARTVRVATVGDSITAGVHSSGGNHTYPFQLQMMLDAKHGALAVAMCPNPAAAVLWRDRAAPWP